MTGQKMGIEAQMMAKSISMHAIVRGVGYHHVKSIANGSSYLFLKMFQARRIDMSTALWDRSVAATAAVLRYIHRTKGEKTSERNDLSPTYSRSQIDRHRYGKYDSVQDHVAYREAIHGYQGALFGREPGSPALTRVSAVQQGRQSVSGRTFWWRHLLSVPKPRDREAGEESLDAPKERPKACSAH
jgi:hypothetical protein